jgi:uncharacterized protein (TIGR02145 family)
LNEGNYFYKFSKLTYSNMKQTTPPSTALFKQFLLVGLLLTAFLASFGLQAQTTVTLPAACDNCPVTGVDLSSNGTAVIGSLGASGCASGTGTINGTMIVGTPVSGVTMELYANVTTIGSYSLLAVENGVTFAGVGTFTSTGCQLVTLFTSGTPTLAGPFTWTTNTTPSGSGVATVDAVPEVSTNGTGAAASFGSPTCPANSIVGTMTVGAPVSGVTMSLYANITTLGTYDITAGPTNGVTFTGSGTFAALGCQLITLTATGTPSAVGTNSFATNTTPVATVSGTAAAVVAPTNPIGTGGFSGKTCFDVALGNDNTNSCGSLSSRIGLQADFTLAATHTQAYTFTPRGTVSNVRFTYVNTNGAPIIALSGGNTGNNISTAVIATVNFSTSLSGLATGLTSTNSLTADIYVTYNDGATNNGTDVQLKITPKIKDCGCCVVKVSPTQYKEFMCHNLGADESLDPHVAVQAIEGDLYQWGKADPLADAYTDPGPLWAPTSIPVSQSLDSAWTDFEKAVNDPCPAGYRVPTSDDWLRVRAFNARSVTGSTVHFGPDVNTKSLSLPNAGFRSANDGSLIKLSSSFYWSSTFEPTISTDPINAHQGATSFYHGPTNSAPTFDHPRTQGMSVRCISE